MITVIIPTYNRADNMALVLASLDCQTKNPDEVIVVDDGGSDRTLEVVSQYTKRLNIRYIWHPHAGFQAGLSRNEGARLARGDSLLFIDSDVLLNPKALVHYSNLVEANPTAVIAGRYDWLPPMMISAEDVYTRWHSIVQSELPAWTLAGAPDGIVGIDPRAHTVSRFTSEVVTEGYCLALFSGNIIYPKEQYWDLGGFDEAMVGHGGEDCELAMRAQEHAQPVIFNELVVGYHVYHPRNQAQNEIEVARNIAYIRTIHDLVALGVEPDPDAMSIDPVIGAGKSEA